MPIGNVQHVEEAAAGSELAVDVSGTGATTITVEDPTDFQPEGGELLIGGVEKGYATVNEETGVITLDAAIGTVYLTGEPVYALPLSTERFAHVLVEGDAETLQARVPHGLYERVPVGARDGNVDELELVELVRDSSGELFVADVLEREPVIDGTYIDPATLPTPPLTDGNPPTVSPTPTVVGLIGELFVTWVAVANNDLVAYEVHVSTSSGFVPGAGTYAGETVGTRFSIGALPGTTTPPAAGTTYFVKLIAKDDDGAAAAGGEGSGTPALVNSPDIAANAVIAAKILAGEIKATHFEAMMILVTTLMAGAEGGPRVEFGVTEHDGENMLGLHAFRNASDLSFMLDGITGDVYIKGRIDWGTAPVANPERPSRLTLDNLIEIQEQVASGFQTPTPVQSRQAQSIAGSPTSTATCSWSGPTSSGNLLLLGLVVRDPDGVPPTPTTPTGWTLVTSVLKDDMRLLLYKIENAASRSGSQAITLGDSVNWIVHMVEFSGVQLQDVFASNSGTGTATDSGTTATTTQASELWWALIGNDNEPGSNVTNGFTEQLSTSIFGDLALGSYRKIVAATGTANTGTTLASSQDWAGIVVTFKAKAATGEPGTPEVGLTRLYARDVATVPRLHVKDDAGLESALVMGKKGEVWRMEIVAVSVTFPADAAQSGGTLTVSIPGLAVGDFFMMLDNPPDNGVFVSPRNPCAVAGSAAFNIFNADNVTSVGGTVTTNFLVLHRS